MASFSSSAKAEVCRDFPPDAVFYVRARFNPQCQPARKLPARECRYKSAHWAGRGIYVGYLCCAAGGGIYTGATVNRNERFGYTIEGIDALIVGHTHKGTISKPKKIVVDSNNNVIRTKQLVVVSCTAWQHYGGYAARKMLLPSAESDAEQPQTLLLGCNKHGDKRITVVW